MPPKFTKRTGADSNANVQLRDNAQLIPSSWYTSVDVLLVNVIEVHSTQNGIPPRLPMSKQGADLGLMEVRSNNAYRKAKKRC